MFEEDGGELEFIGRAKPRQKPVTPSEQPEQPDYDYSHLEGVVDPAIIEAFKRDDRKRRESGERWEVED